MGNCMVGESPYRVLRYSLPGALLPSENDFRDFFHICQTETHKISSQLPITSTQSFFVVVSGEILVTISVKDKRPEIVSTVLPGDMIFFFGVNTEALIVNGCMEFDKIKVGLQFRSSDGLAQVVGSDYSAVAQFLDHRPYLTSLRALMEMKLDSFFASSGFLSLTKNQIHALAPLIRVRAVKAGQVLRYAMRDPNYEYLALTPYDNATLIVPPISNTSVGMLLSGLGIAIPSGSDLSDLIHDRRAQFQSLHPQNSSPLQSTTNRGNGSSVRSSSDHTHSQYTPHHNKPNNYPHAKRSILGHIREYYTGARALRGYSPSSTEHGNNGVSSSMAELFTPELKAELVKMYPGAIFGLEQQLVKNATIGLDSIVSLESSLVGYLENDALQAFFNADRRLKRVLQRNWLKGVLDSVRSVVPILSEMEDKGYVVLSTLISLKCFDKNDIVFARGAPSDHSYIVVRGLICESTQSTITIEETGEYMDARYLGYGTLFGEVSLVTDSPYFTSTHAVEPSLLVCINKRALERIFQHDRAKIAEMRLRLVSSDTGNAGTNEVELTHLLDHPAGNRLLLEFLQQELSAENLHFLNAVAKFEEVCARLGREVRRRQVQHEHFLAHALRIMTGSVKKREEEALAIANTTNGNAGSVGNTGSNDERGSDVAAVDRGARGRSASSHNAPIHTQEVEDEDDRTPSSSAAFSHSHTHNNDNSIGIYGLGPLASSSSFRIDDNTGTSSLYLDNSLLFRGGSGGSSATGVSGSVCVVDYVEALERRRQSNAHTTQPHNSHANGNNNNTNNNANGGSGGGSDNISRKPSGVDVNVLSSVTTAGKDVLPAVTNENDTLSRTHSHSASIQASGALQRQGSRRANAPSVAQTPTSNTAGPRVVSVTVSAVSLSRHNSHREREKETAPSPSSAAQPSMSQLLENTHTHSNNDSRAWYSTNNVLSSAALNSTGNGEFSTQEYSSAVQRAFAPLIAQVSELRSVARDVCARYVAAQSESEVNVSAATRERTLNALAEWTALSPHETLRRLARTPTQAQAQTQMKPHVQVHTNADSNTPTQHPPVGTGTAPSHNSGTQPPSTAVPIDGTSNCNAASNYVLPFTSPQAWSDRDANPRTPLVDHTVIFAQAKSDIEQLLRRDAFLRFKQSPEFANFIAGIRPFEHHHHMSSSASVIHTTHHTTTHTQRSVTSTCSSVQPPPVQQPAAPTESAVGAVGVVQHNNSNSSVQHAVHYAVEQTTVLFDKEDDHSPPNILHTPLKPSSPLPLRRVSFHRAPQHTPLSTHNSARSHIGNLSSTNLTKDMSSHGLLVDNGASSKSRSHSHCSHSHTPLPTVPDTSPLVSLSQRKKQLSSMETEKEILCESDETMPFDVNTFTHTHTDTQSLSRSHRHGQTESERDDDDVRCVSVLSGSVSQKRTGANVRVLTHNTVVPIG